MFVRKGHGPVSVKLPDGTIITRGDLPPADTSRWVAKKKKVVVVAVTAGLISLKEACRVYNLSEEEFRIWEKALLDHGSKALRATHLKRYRQP